MIHDTNDLLYSTEAAKTRAIYYQDLNEVNIFVEDAQKEYLYETIFKRLLKDQYKIDTIFGVGGKLAVIESYNEFGKDYAGTKNFYLVDGDFDRYISPESMIIDDCFLYLKSYNIENYLIDENACISFIKGRMHCTDKIVRTKIDFTNWKDRIVKESTKLFLCYCAIKKYHPEVTTVGQNPYLFLEQKTGFERLDNAFSRIESVYMSVDNTLHQHIELIEKEYEKINGSNYFNLICGKFLLTSLACHLRNISGEKFNHADLEWHLVNAFDIEKLDYVRTAILAIAS